MNLWAESNGTSRSRGRSPAQGGDVDAALLREHDQGALGRVADHLAVARARRRCTAPSRAARRRQLPRQRRPVGGADPAVGGVALAGDGEPAAGQQQLPRGHLVEGQRAGLVGADLRGAAQRLHRRRAASRWRRCLASRAVPMARVNATTAGSPSGMAATARDTALTNSVGEVLPADQPQDEHDHDDDPAMMASVRLSASIWRCSGVGSGLGLVQHAGDAADLGAHAGGGDHQLAAPPGDRGVHEHRGRAVAQRRVRRRPRRRPTSATGCASPVSEDSWTSSEVATSSRPSAGTRSPASSTTRRRAPAPRRPADASGRRGGPPRW